MDARSNIKGRVPSRHGTVGLARAVPSFSAADVAATGEATDAAPHLSANKFDSGEIFKKTPCAAGLNPAGRYVAKDLRETGVISLLMKTLLENGQRDGNCLTVMGPTITENLTSGKRDSHPDLVRTAGGADVGSLNEKVTDAGPAEHETKWRPRATNCSSGALWNRPCGLGWRWMALFPIRVVRTRTSVMRTSRRIVFALMLGAAPVAGPGFAFDGAPVNPKDAALPVVSQPAAQVLNSQVLNGQSLGGGLGGTALKKAVPPATAAAAATSTSLSSLQYAAEDGHPVAQWKLGRMYADGDGVTQDDLRAFEYFSRIANQHAEDSPSAPQAAIVANAFVALGRYYLNGIPNSKVKVDRERAREMFSYAASYFGNADAQYDLARLYLKTPDASRDDFRYGARWLGLAAQKGQHQAQALLGQMLFNGDRLPPQRARGLMWLTLARDSATADEVWIKESYNRAITKASEDDRAMALQMLEHWVQGRKD
ncbi:MAG: SEL1-like repeat protein [Rhizobiales bacterium]|nr:SEL1-like repeat protein [Hyphomicrobiales bacterium]